MKLLDVDKDEIDRFGINKGDLIFARRSLTAEGAGKCIWVREAEDEAVFESSLIRARANDNIADSQYLYYYFNSPAGKTNLGSILRQVAVSGITGSDLMELLIPAQLGHSRAPCRRRLGSSAARTFRHATGNRAFNV